LIKATGEEEIRTLTALCNAMWNKGTWPEEWKKSIFIPIPKSEDLTDCANYRTIALISHTSKVLLKSIQARMEQHVERELPDLQAGFRRNRGTRDHISNIRRIMERSREYNQDVFLCFIDYKKAFDCVDHELMWITLQEMGFPEHLIDLLQELYRDQEAKVRTEFGETDSFKIGKGLRQGCPLSPSKFNMYAERVMRKAGMEEADEELRMGGRKINNLRYTTLIAANITDLQDLLQKVKNSSEKTGLFLNLKKTKIMSTTNCRVSKWAMKSWRWYQVSPF